MYLDKFHIIFNNYYIQQFGVGIILRLRLSTSGYNYSHNRCVDIVEWFVNEYLSPYKLEINVHHRRLVKRDGVFGWAWATDSDSRPREFEIEIHNQLDPENYTKTLLHELMHVYQHVEGSLKDKHGKRLWKGIDSSELDYDDQPWEKEAHQMEDILYKKYISCNAL